MRSWILALIFLLYGSSMAKGTDPPNGTSNAKPITLDIKSPNTATIEKHNLRLHDFKTPSYTAKDGYYIQKVVEGDAEICKGLPKRAFIKVTHPHRNSMFGMVHLYIMEQDGKNSSRYFYKNGGVWNEIGEEDFYNKFHALSSTEHAFYEEAFLLVDKRDPWRLYINESIKSPFVVYGPKTTCRVIEIKTKKDDNTSIWKRKKDEWCTKITLYPKTGDYKLMWIVTKDPYEKEEILYYSKSSESWKEVTRDAYLEDLKKSGFKESEFNDKVTLNIARPDKLLFFEDKYNVDIVTMNRYHVLPGFRISKVVDGNSLIWESTDDKFATYFRLNTRGSKVLLGALFTTNTRKEHKIIYYRKVDGSWTVIQKSLYYDILAGRGSPVYTREAPKPKITMSSFRNKKDLKVVSYAFTIEDAKADIILVHGIKGSVITDFGTFDMDWSYERYGFDIFPHVSIFDKPVEVKRPSNVERYRQYFEYKTLEGMNPYDILVRSRYEGTFLEALNRLGYNVYGYDLQSHGLSEAQTNKKCHAGEYIDYIYDVMQFVNIIRRGKFNDASQVYNEQTILQSVECDRNIILIGYSLGGNIVIRAVEKFYKKVKTPQAKFVDALIGLSTMLDLEFYMSAWYKKGAVPLFKFITWVTPTTDGFFQYPYDIGINFERFSDYHNDMLYYNRILTRRTTADSFLVSREARHKKRVKLIPKGLPILFMHTVDDSQCDVKGPHTFISRLEDSKSAKILEFKGDGHHFVAIQLVPIVIPQLSSWLDERFYGGAKYLIPKSLSVLLSRVDSSIFNVQERMENGIPVLRLKVKPGKKATKLVYMGRTIWSGSSCSSCCISPCCVSAGCASSLSSATLYFNGTVLELVKVSVGDTEKLLHRTKTKRCKRTSIKWVHNETKFGKRLKWLEEASNLDAFLPKLEEMDEAVPTPEETLSLPEHPTHSSELSNEDTVPSSQEDTTPSPIPTIKDTILDITDVDLRVVTMSESFLDGMLVKKTFTPNDGCRLMEVLDMNLSVWRSGGQNEHAKSVVVHYDGGTPISVVTYTNLTAGLHPGCT